MSWRVIAVLLICLVVAGCADSDGNADNDKDNRFGGFYGGISGGGAAGMGH